ncbi:hypothetical protein SNEBB_003706 [Seison nebaliae]|nr:hypothetical protein SNEBB_003706 [Seison nebaliae]
MSKYLDNAARKSDGYEELANDEHIFERDTDGWGLTAFVPNSTFLQSNSIPRVSRYKGKTKSGKVNSEVQDVGLKVKRQTLGETDTYRLQHSSKYQAASIRRITGGMTSDPVIYKDEVQQCEDELETKRLDHHYRLHKHESRLLRFYPYGFRSEAKKISVLALPIVLAHILQKMIPLCSSIFAGHLGKHELDAVALAVSFTNVAILSIGEGLATACDTLFSQTYGAGNKKGVGIILQRALIILMLACFPCSALLLNTEHLLVLLKQDAEVARLAGIFCQICIPGVVFSFIYTILVKYVQNQNVVRPLLYNAMIANVLNIGYHFFFVTYLQWSVGGCAIAVDCAFFTLFFLSIVYIKWSKMYQATWSGISIGALQNWSSFLWLAIPGIFMICCEWWYMELCDFITGTIGVVELGTQSTLVELFDLCYQVPFGFAIASSIRIGNYLGRNKPLGAATVSRMAYTLAVFWSLGLFTVIISCRHYLPRIFTSDRDIVALSSKVLTFASIQVVVDTFSAVSSGTLRGTGKQAVGAIVNFIGYYVIGLPVGLSLLLKTSLVLNGLWIGILCATSTQIIVFIPFILKINWENEAEKAQERAGIFEREEMETSQEIETFGERFQWVQKAQSNEDTFNSNDEKRNESMKNYYSITTTDSVELSIEEHSEKQPLLNDRVIRVNEKWRIIRQKLFVLFIFIMITVGGVILRMKLTYDIDWYELCLVSENVTDYRKFGKRSMMLPLHYANDSIHFKFCNESMLV